MEKQTLYHGSNVIVKQPLVNIGRKDFDFGPGFYLTPLFEQASKWAIRIKTIQIFYDSDVCRMLHDKDLWLHLMSDTYIVNDLIAELRNNQ